jgi:hypothetical protein
MFVPDSKQQPPEEWSVASVDLTLPNNERPPSGPRQSACHHHVALSIERYLARPKSFIEGRHPNATFVAVPKTTVDEQGYPPTGKRDVGSPVHGPM